MIALAIIIGVALTVYLAFGITIFIEVFKRGTKFEQDALLGFKFRIWFTWLEYTLAIAELRLHVNEDELPDLWASSFNTEKDILAANLFVRVLLSWIKEKE